MNIINGKLKRHLETVKQHCKMKQRTYSPLIDYYCKSNNLEKLLEIYKETRLHNIELIDMNSDGTLDILDVILLVNIILGN